MTLAIPHTQFDRSPTSDATEPPEAHGVARDGVKLLVAQPSGISHARFADLGGYLRPGDLLVVNNSATLPAAVDGSRSGQPITVHFSTDGGDHVWVVELRPATTATGHLPDIRAGERIDLPDGAALVVDSSYPESGVAGSRLWTSRLAIEGDVMSYLARHGRPIRYSYVPRQWPLSDYQTVFARQPGSAEMASAARPFSTELVTSLVTSGITIAPITLHAGVSSADGRRATGRREVRRPADHCSVGEPDARDRRPGDRGRHDGDPRPRVRRNHRWTRARGRRLDGSCPGAGSTSARGRRPDHRLARCGRLAPAAARGSRRT